MRRRFLLFGISIIGFSVCHGQAKKHFSVNNDQKVREVDLDFSINSGSCIVKPGEGDELLSLYTTQTQDSYSHSYEKETRHGICHIDLDLENNKSEGFSQSISYRMFGRSEKEEKKEWDLYLTEKKPYDLDFNYGIGNANIDLSGLSIHKLKIHTGSADVNVGYLTNKVNAVEMDTFYVKVDLGSVEVKQLNLSKSKHVVADIGFGNLLLDFSDTPQIASDIKGSVGAGNLLIVLPEDDTPVIVTVNDSWLCRVKLTNSFKKLSDNTFVNAAYTEDAHNLLSFNLDVSMGSIVFKEK